jgi:cell division protein FtsL
MYSNANSKVNKALIGLILVLIIICSLTAVFTFNTQNKLENLQSSYNRLTTEYSNLQNELNNLQSSLNTVENEILLNSSQERISIARVAAFNESSVTVWAKSLTGVDVVIVDVVVRDSSDHIIAQNNRQMTPTILSAMGKLRTIEINFQNANLSFGTAYTITLTTEKGNNFTYPSFTRSNVTPTPNT